MNKTYPAKPIDSCCRRSGFTIVELLVAVVILAVLASLSLAGMATARKRVRIDRTRNTIRKIHEIVMPQYESYARRRVPATAVGVSPPALGSLDVFMTYADTSGTVASYYGPRLPNGAWPSVVKEKVSRSLALSRLQMLRTIQIFELPDSWGDVAPSTAAVLSGTFFPSAPSTSYARTGPVLSYAAYRQSLTVSGSTSFMDENGSAECLYMIVARGAFEPDVMERFRADEIGDTDNDRAPEFIDGWGRPIKFIRWAPGVSAVGFPRPSPIQIADPSAYHDPLDPGRVDAAGFALIPLVYSEGPDGVANSLRGTGTAGWSSQLVGAATLLSITGAANTNGSPVGDGSAAVSDNISNHDLMKK